MGAYAHFPLENLHNNIITDKECNPYHPTEVKDLRFSTSIVHNCINTVIYNVFTSKRFVSVPCSKTLFSLANASCEWWFPTMKRVKSDWRCTLGNNTMDMLMRAKIEGPKKQADYCPRDAVNRWRMAKETTKLTLWYTLFSHLFLLLRSLKIFTLIWFSKGKWRHWKVASEVPTFASKI